MQSQHLLTFAAIAALALSPLDLAAQEGEAPSESAAPAESAPAPSEAKAPKADETPEAAPAPAPSTPPDTARMPPKPRDPTSDVTPPAPEGDTATTPEGWLPPPSGDAEPRRFNHGQSLPSGEDEGPATEGDETEHHGCKAKHGKGHHDGKGHHKGHHKCHGEEGGHHGHCKHGHHGEGHHPATALPPKGGRGLQFKGDSGWRLSFDGNLRVEAATLTPDRFLGIKLGADEGQRRNPYVGRNDGFALGNARLNIRAHYGDLYARISIQGAMVTYADELDTQGTLSSGVADAYFRYTFASFAQLTAGRFKPPFDVEQLTPTIGQYFVRRSLESRGVRRHEGYSADTTGFRPGRQIGLMLSGKILEIDGTNLGYSLAVTNGNRGAPAFNDNDLPAVYARVFGGHEFGDAEEGATAAADEEGPATYSSKPGVQGGLSFAYDEVTLGNPPNRQRDRQLMMGADVALKAFFIYVQGQVLYQSTKHLTFTSAGSESALGFHAQLSVLLPWGISPGYRFAYYDPTSISGSPAGTDDFDRVMHHTIGVRWDVPTLPMVGLLDFTRSIEQSSRAVPNDRIELAVQVTFE